MIEPGARHGPVVLAALAATKGLATVFADASHRLFLVGGVVRDDRIGRTRDDADYDLTTDARPEKIKSLVGPLAEAVWTQGERFGTIGCTIDGRPYEITTHRADTYDPDSRKPIVAFGDKVVDDLARRDFTINAMAVDLADGTLVDPFGGAEDLDAGVLRTPLDPEISFSDDPLRMVRAARFIATIGVRPDPRVVEAVVAMRDRMAIVAVERIRDELEKMMMLADPQPGFAFLSATGLLHEVLPAVAAAQLADHVVGARVALVNDDPTLRDLHAARWSALLLDAPVNLRASALAHLKPSGELSQHVTWLLGAAEWMGSGSAPTAAPALRRLAAAAPKPATLEDRLRFVQAVAPNDDVDEALAVVAHLRSMESDLDAPRPPLTGKQVADHLGVSPGPVIGEANAMLLEHRYAHGPAAPKLALRLLDDWWSDRA
ncbi:MAG: CCA tRNA nucleotidyltransferase [Actinomycetota bacterium]